MPGKKDFPIWASFRGLPFLLFNLWIFVRSGIEGEMLV
jgi:hypothetical protein